MKYGNLSKLSLVGLIGLSFLSYSCSEENKVDKEIEPEIPEQSEALTPTEQKRKMETIANQFMAEVPSSDFRAIADLFNDLNQEYEDYDWDEAEDWMEECLDDCKEFLGESKETSGSSYGIYNYFYTDYKALYMASNFAGHFTAQNGEWEYTKAKDLQFIMPKHDCVVKLETSGEVKKVYLGNIEEWTEGSYDYDYYTGQYVSNEYYDRMQTTIGVPEKITLTLTQGGSNVVKCVVTTDLSGINDEKLDISKSGLSVTVLTELNNGYKVNLSECDYKGNKSASCALTVSKKDKALLAMGVAADVVDLPSYNLDAFVSDELDDDELEDKLEDANVSKAFVKLDILGKLQVQGTVTDVRGFVRKIEKAEDNETKELAFKSYVNQANELMNINLFYDGSSTTQAYVKLEPFREEGWYDDEFWWEAEPVIYFYDGSSYSTFETFFNEYDFDNVIDAFEELIEDYEGMIED